MSRYEPLYIGRRIREARARKGYSQEELSKLAGVYHALISSIEKGKSQSVSAKTLVDICDALGGEITPNDLLGYERPKPANGVPFKRQMGRTIRDYRLRSGLTQQKAADKYGCTLRYWQFLEQGQNISIKAILKLAKVFDVKPSKLLE